MRSVAARRNGANSSPTASGGDRLFHTYSTYQRGLDALLTTYHYLDLTPLGRHEDDEVWSMAWVRHHDR